ncbi:DUF4259 domain-containing protein [Streptomyces sp. NPDC052071]|uniref:DUF4259 domain-containing protein n=1 Tax=Streptomyces TaxID=1883 RepID=UPI0033EA9852
MGTWGTGPFDNDLAADYALLLDRSGVPEVLLRHALSEPGSTRIENWEVTVAAAAVIASSCPGGEPLHPVYGPQKPLPPLPPRSAGPRGCGPRHHPHPPSTDLWMGERTARHTLALRPRPTARGARSDAREADPAAPTPVSGLPPHPGGARLGPPSPLTSPTQQGPS